MNRRVLLGPVIGVIFCLTVMVLPQLVVAEVQTPVTEIIDLPAATDDNDEVVNPSNATITTNKDTWTPLPEGLFVGGTIAESLMQFNELPIEESTLYVSTQVRFSRTYLMNGASEFVVRLPFYIQDSSVVWYVKLDVFDITASSEVMPAFQLGAGYSPPMVWANGSDDERVASYSDVANFWEHIGDPGTEEIWDDVSHNSYLSEGRLYVKLVCPIFVEHTYQFTARITTNDSTPMQMYWNPSDLASDSITSSRVSYIWNLAVDQAHVRDYEVPADAGWSFVFQAGIGGNGRDWDMWIPAGTTLTWDKYVLVSGAVCTGALTFIMEFRTNYSDDLKYDLNITAINDTSYPAGSVDVLKGGHGNYWHDMMARNVIIAARPENQTLPIVLMDGEYYVHFSIELRIIDMLRLQVMLEADRDVNQNNAVLFQDMNGVDVEKVWFSPWCTCLIQDSVYNETWAVAIKKNHKGFWEGIGHWWDEHWLDIANVLILAGGMFLMCIPGGQVFGLALLAAGITLYLYDNFDWFRNLVNGAIGLIIDGLKWLGNWLYKIGMAIWKALTWLVDQAIYFGGQLIAIVIYAMAVLVPVVIITMATKLFSMFFKIAKGDLEGATAEGKAMVSTVSGAVDKVRGMV